jgi:signal transduction histidine kinase
VVTETYHVPTLRNPSSCNNALDLCQQTTEEERAVLANLLQEARGRAANAPSLDPLTQTDREDEITTWLDKFNISNSWKLAPTFVTAGLDTDWLSTLASQVASKSLSSVLTWLEASLTSQRLLDGLNHSTSRISQLVQSIKDYSYMDQAPVQDVDIHEGLESTIIMLNHKLKPGITIVRDYDRQIPRITAYGSELNQVWTNLIDNAIDALQECREFSVLGSALSSELKDSTQNSKLKTQNSTPTILLRTRLETNNVLVEIIDNGPGISPEAQSHIFEPFFTTKVVGKGTGLGLHIAYRIVVGQHHGDLRVLSQPGNTRFQIRLPLHLI